MNTFEINNIKDELSTFKLILFEKNTDKVINEMNIYVYDLDCIIDIIKGEIAKKFNTEVEKIKFYTDTTISTLYKLKKTLINYDPNKTKNKLRCLLNHLSLLSVNNQFYIKRKMNNYSKYILYNDDMGKVLFCIMFCLIDKKEMLEDTMDKIFTRYKYKIDSDECIGELQYYLNGNYFIEL